MKNLRLAILSAPLGLVLACGGGDVKAGETEPAAEKAVDTPDSPEQPSAADVEDVTNAAEDVLDTAAGEASARKAELEEDISGWETTLAEKQEELEAILARIKELSPADLLGAEGKQLKLDSESLQKVIDELTKKIDAARSELAALGR